MALRYWVGTTTSWNTSGNWSTSSGGGGGASVPTSLDDVFFDTGSQNCTLDVNVDCKSWTTSAGYTGDIGCAGYTITAHNGSINLDHAGRFTGNSSTDITVAGNYHYGSGLTNSSSSCGTITFTASGTYDYDDAGTVFHATGGLVIDPGVVVTQTGAANQRIANTSGACLTMGNGSTFTQNSTAVNLRMNASGAFLSLTGTTTINGTSNIRFDINAAGAITATIPAFTYSGSAAIDLDISFPALGHTFQLTGDVDVSSGSLTHNLGNNGAIDLNGHTLTAGAYSETLASTEQLKLNGGTFDCSSFSLTGTGGTLDMSTGTIDCAGNFTLGSSLTVSNVSTSTIDITGTCAFTSNGKTLGNLTQNSGANAITLQDALICKSFTGTQGNLDYNGNTFTCNNGSFNFDGTGDLTADGATSVAGDFHVGSSSSPSINAVIFTASGNFDVDKSLAIGGGLQMSGNGINVVITSSTNNNISANPVITAGDNCILTQSGGGQQRFTCNANGGSFFSVGTNFQFVLSSSQTMEQNFSQTVYLGDFSLSGSSGNMVVTINLGGTIILSSDINITGRPASFSIRALTGSAGVFDSAGYTINSDASLSFGNTAGTAYTVDIAGSTINCGSMTCSRTSSGTFTMDMDGITVNSSGDITLDDDITLQNASNSTINITGTSTLTSAGQTLGIINANTSGDVLTFADAFNARLKAEPNGKFRLKADSTNTWHTYISGDVDGAKGSLVEFDTDSAGTGALINTPTGIKTYYASFTDTTASNEIKAYTVFGNVDAGNNSNIDFDAIAGPVAAGTNRMLDVESELIMDYAGGYDFKSGVSAFDSNVQVRGGTYNLGHLRLGSYHLWIDSTGNLRIKNGEPTSSSDGAVVGTQS